MTMFDYEVDAEALAEFEAHDKPGKVVPISRGRNIEAVQRAREREKEKRRQQAAAADGSNGDGQENSPHLEWDLARDRRKWEAINEGERRILDLRVPDKVVEIGAGNNWRGAARNERLRLRQEARQAAEMRGWPHDWTRKSISRLFGDVKIHQIATLDGEWIPPDDEEFGNKEFQPRASGTPDHDPSAHEKRQYSKPLEQRVFTLFDGFQIPGSDETSLDFDVNASGYRSYQSIANLLHDILVVRREETTKTWFFAHSGGKSDYLFLFNEIIRTYNGKDKNSAGYWETKCDQAGSRMQFVTVRFGYVIDPSLKGGAFQS